MSSIDTPSWSAPRVELLHVLMLADLKRAERCPRPRDREMNSFWLVSSANPRPYEPSSGARDAFAKGRVWPALPPHSRPAIRTSCATLLRSLVRGGLVPDAIRSVR